MQLPFSLRPRRCVALDARHYYVCWFLNNRLVAMTVSQYRTQLNLHSLVHLPGHIVTVPIPP